MSIHFAPQWVKPIKPTGSLVTPTAEQPNPLKSAGSTHNHHNQHQHTSSSASSANVPFPALSSNGGPTAHASSATNNPPLSYSRATHTSTTPGFPSDSSYFPYTEPNGRPNGNPHPFRYSREQMLGLWDEDKVRNTPIELVDMLESGAVLVSKSVVRPIGLRDPTDVEKKILSSSIHPPNPTRRQPSSNAVIDPALTPGQMSRRTIGQTGGKDMSVPGRGGAGGAFGAFGSGKIGTIGGGLLSPGAGPGEVGRAPGALGGGFGGVGRRAGRKVDGVESGPWRTGRTASGSFEGVLGFGGPATQERNVSGGNAETPGEAKDVERDPASGRVVGGGPGWGTGQKKWRIAAGLAAPENEKPQVLTIPVQSYEQSSESVAATASATPRQERDALVEDVAAPTETPAAVDQPPPVQEKEDLGAVEWFYRDPGGQEQGPFTGTQMHDWYSHSYFTDDLPLRRASETSFHSLAELKTATGNAVQPFLSAVRPRLPPNLPLPLAAAQPTAVNHVAESLRNMGMASPAASSPVAQPSYNQFTPDRSVLSPAHFAQQNAFANQLPSPATYLPSPGQWGAPQPRMNTFGSVGMPSPIGSAPLSYVQQPPQPIYSPVIGGPVGRDGRDFFSPSVGAGAHAASPWGAPPMQPNFGQPLPPAPWHQEPQQQHHIPQPQFQQQQQNQNQQPQPIQQTQQQQQQQHSEPVAQPVQDEPSYFPSEAVAEPSKEPEPVAQADNDEQAVEDEEMVERELTPEEPEAAVEAPAHVEEPVVAQPESKPPASVWGQKNKVSGTAPSSRKSSIAGSTAPVQPITPASSKLPPAPSSLPAKPASTTSEAAETVNTPVDKPAAAPRPAPWADKDTRSNSTGPSLREIQQAEAKEAEARKAARAAAASPAPVPTANDDIPQNLTWGLPTSSKSAAPAAPAVSTPSTPAWGGSEAAPKKTLKQIQEEEEKRKLKAAQAARAAQTTNGPAAAAASTPGAKRGYADLAAASQPPGAGWTTVGSKPSPAPTPAAAPTRTASSVVKPPVAAAAAGKASTPAAAKPKVDESAGPSIDFIRWTKQSLTGLNVNVDDFIQMLLTFPIDPPTADRPGILEVISDSVYANSSTLDGRRFAQEFFTRRKADAARPKTATGSSSAVSKSSLADVVKSVPKKTEDAGFRIVKAKGKKKN